MYSCLPVKHGVVLFGILNFKEQPVDNITPLALPKTNLPFRAA